MLFYKVRMNVLTSEAIQLYIRIPPSTFLFLFSPVTVSTPTILGCQLVKQMNLWGPGPIFTTSFEAYYCSSAVTSKGYRQDRQPCVYNLLPNASSIAS